MKELLHHSASLSRSVQMTFPVHVRIPRSPFLIPSPFTCHRERGIHRPFFLFPPECQRQGKCHTKNLLQHYNRLPSPPVQPQGVVQPWALGRSHLTLRFKITAKENGTRYKASYLHAVYVQLKQITKLWMTKCWDVQIGTRVNHLSSNTWKSLGNICDLVSENEASSEV